MTDVRLEEFAALLAKVDTAERESLIARAKLLAMNQVAPEAFDPPIATLGTYLARDLPVPPILVEPAIVVRGGITCTVGRAGKGKRSSDDTPVLTPSGWKRIDALSVGDEIIDPDGGTSNVTGVFPAGIQETYRVTFSDGTSTKCGPEHLWLVRDHTSNFNQVLELRDIVAKGLKYGSGARKWFIPLVQPCEFPEKDIGIDPYLLGYLLGDGGMSNGNLNFVTNDLESVARLEAKLPEKCSLRKCGQHSLRWRIVGPSQAEDNPAISALRALGLWGCHGNDKFVPDALMTASVEQRTALLQGLMDSDGSVTRQGHLRFWSSSEALANGVAALARSLGGIATVTSRTRDASNVSPTGYTIAATRPAYSVSLSVPVQPVLLTRKLERYVRPTRAFKAIDKVERVEDQPCRCISTSSKRHLYVVDDYIVTHNTQVNLNRILKWAAGKPMFPGLKTADEDAVRVLHPTQPLKILIIENEGAAGMFHRQIGVMLNADGRFAPTERELVKENVLIWGDGGYSGLKLDDPHQLNMVRAGCEKWEPDIVFVEPFRGLWQGDENSSTDMAKVADALSGIASDYDCGVILTHHERKSGAGDDGEKMSAGRGSTVLEGVVAVMENFEQAKGGDFRELSWSKSRYFGGKILPVRMEWKQKQWWYDHVPLEKVENGLLEALASNEDGLSVKDLVLETDEKETEIRKHLKSLEKEGKIKSMAGSYSGDGSTGKRYRLAISTGNDESLDF